MSDRSEDGGELHAGETYVASSGRCRFIATTRLDWCVCPVTKGYIGVDFAAGEEHAFERLEWKNKNRSTGFGFVVRTADGDAYLMPHLFERYCEVMGASVPDGWEASPPRGEAGQQTAVPPPASRPRPTVRPVRVVNVKGLNKPEQRKGIVYVGRKFAGWPEHELHNPFKPAAGEPIGTCLGKYRASLLARLTLEDDLAALWAETERGKRPLGCWCCTAVAGDGSEVVCHAQILAEMLAERFSKE